MHPAVFSYTPADDDTSGFAAAVTGAGPIFIPTATSASDGLAHIVSITSAANLVAIVFNIVGTDADGIPQAEALSGPGATTVYGTLFFKTVEHISISNTLGANTADVGWKDECVSPTHPLNWRANEFNVSLGVNISGTINYSIEHCLQRMSDGAPSTLTWWTHPSLVTLAVDSAGNYTSPVTATRLHIHAVTAGATANFFVLQGV